MILDEMKSMKLHETIVVKLITIHEGQEQSGSIAIIRVPNGWLYCSLLGGLPFQTFVPELL